jgi:hypothetical protein
VLVLSPSDAAPRSDHLATFKGDAMTNRSNDPLRNGRKARVRRNAERVAAADADAALSEVQALQLALTEAIAEAFVMLGRALDPAMLTVRFRDGSDVVQVFDGAQLLTTLDRSVIMARAEQLSRGRHLDA